MKEQIKVWGSRVFALALLAVVVQQWGMPQYKKYFTPKASSVYVPTAKAKAGLFTVSFHEMGTLQAEKSVPIMSEINGKLVYLVGEGSMVTTGTKLAEIDTSDLKRDVINQQLEFNNKQADVERANAEMEILRKQNETELAQSQAQLDFDKTELELARERLSRKKNLLTDKLVTRSEVDQAELEVRSKELSVLKGEKSLALKQEEIKNKEQQKKADVRNVQFRVQLSKMSLEEAERRVNKAIIKAPASGMVVLDTDWWNGERRKLQSGDSVRPQQTLGTLPDLTSMLVKIQLGEADAPKVQIGLPVLIRLEAVPKRIFHGTVKSIASLATEPMPWERTSNNGKSFDVTIAIKEVEPKTLKPGMTADAEFIRKTVKDAVYIPLESVIESEGKTYVYVKHGKGWNKSDRVEVKLGTSNDNFVCVTKGVKAGEVVALRDPTKPMDDQSSGSESKDGDEADKKDKEPVPLPSVTKK